MNLNIESNFMGFKCWAKINYFMMSSLIIFDFNCYSNSSLNFVLSKAEAKILIFIFLFATFEALKIHYIKYFVFLITFQGGFVDSRRSLFQTIFEIIELEGQ